MTDPDCVENGIVSIRCLPTFLSNISGFLFAGVGVVAVIFLLYGGAKFVTSMGDEIKVAEAKRTLTYALAGTIIVLLSYFIIQVVAFVTGAKCITLLGFDKCR